MADASSETFSDEDLICCKCIGESIVVARIEAEGNQQPCAQCGRLANCWTIGALADVVDPVIRANYYPVDDGFDLPAWETPGDDPVTVVSDLLRVETVIASAIVEEMSDREAFDVNDGDTEFYGDNNLKPQIVHAYPYVEIWNRFEERFKHNARFFDDESRKALDALFGDLPSLAWGAAVLILKPEDSESFLFRARVFFKGEEAEETLRDPARYLGPPPATSTPAGRMNPAGIPAFYGAFSEDVAIAEVRPPVGSTVVVGKFTPLRELRVLDLTKLSTLYHNDSPFSESYVSTQSRLRFLRTFEARVSRVVLPSDETIDYLPTQAVASYVANVLHLDGVVYHSKQAASDEVGEAAAARNIALFGLGAVVEATAAGAPFPAPEEFHYLLQPIVRMLIDEGKAQQDRFPPPTRPALRVETSPLPKVAYISAVKVTLTTLNTFKRDDGEVMIWNDDDLYDRDDE